MTGLDLDAIEARANAATRGSWSAFHWDDEPSFDRGWAVTSDAGDDWVADYLRAEDVAFIAHARTDVPALVAALREARADCETHHTTVVHQCCEDAQAVPSLRAALATVTAERDDWRRRYEALRDGVTGLADRITWKRPEHSPCGTPEQIEACCGSEESCDAMNPSVLLCGASDLRAVVARVEES